jgi:prepilin-type N-terminal cleavage/methylation domain-containing protein
MNRRGFGLIEILIVVAVVALAGYFIMQYVGSTAKTVEQLQKDRPIDRSKLAADRATLGTLQGLVRNYQAEKGQWPPDKATVVGLLMAPPKLQCAGNDFDYDPATGTLPHGHRRRALLTTGLTTTPDRDRWAPGRPRPRTAARSADRAPR